MGQSPVGDFGSATESASYSMKDANNGILINNTHGFFRTTDGAATWTEDVSPVGYFRNFDISYVPGVDNNILLQVKISTELEEDLLSLQIMVQLGLTLMS
ncbi:MAG: hypothetical protein IPP30_10930 [Flavobacterium sp.]|nr:hypothetical protein [Flavobacterium sp.]